MDELLSAAGLTPEPFDVPLHLGPGMPENANWMRTAGAGAGAVGPEEAGSVSA
jgi:hypothetical protein